jgi:hypothetical protein
MESRSLSLVPGSWSNQNDQDQDSGISGILTVRHTQHAEARNGHEATINKDD